jgi:hypothetical protein
VIPVIQATQATAGETLDALLTDLGARKTPHRRSSSLFDHLVGTAEILRRWNQPELLCTAGAVHSIYGTRSFNPRLVSLDRRSEIARAIGERAERLAFLFGAIRRAELFAAIGERIPALPIEVDGQSIEPDDAAALVLMHMANLLEQHTASDREPWLHLLVRWGSLLRGESDVVPALVQGALGLTAAKERELCTLYERALADFAAGRIDEAEPAMRAIAEGYPFLGEPLIWLGRAEEGIRRLDAWGAPWDKRRSLQQWRRFAMDNRASKESMPPRFSAYLSALLPNPRKRVVYPSLRKIPWHEPSDFPIVAALEDEFPRIEREVLAVNAFQRESEPIARNGTWEVAFLYEAGKRHDDICSLCPTLANIVESFPTIRSMGGLIYISRLKPQTTVSPHRAASSVRIRCHLGIAVPEHGCGIMVGGEARTWKAGSCIVFDDSFEHHVWNRSTQERVVVIIDLWHPDLSTREIELLTGLDRYAESKVGWLNRYYAANERARLQANDDCLP